MIDFDAKFHDFYEKWIKDNVGKYTYEEMEDKVPEIYSMWKQAYDEEIGASVEEYLNKFSSEQLVTQFVEVFDSGAEPSSALLDEMESREACLDMLAKMLVEEYAPDVKMYISNVLMEMNRTEECLDVFVGWVLSPKCDGALRDVAVEILKEYPTKTYDALMNGLENADVDTKTLIAEIVVNAEKNDKTYALLEELFMSGKNTALYAGYFGKYGDERAATMLYKALDKCNYLEFTEIRNAIEVLGGTVDDDYRDFTDDEFYKAIKNLK